MTAKIRHFGAALAQLSHWIYLHLVGLRLRLASVTIPNSVASIGENAFNHCTSLTNAIQIWLQRHRALWIAGQQAKP